MGNILTEVAGDALPHACGNAGGVVRPTTGRREVKSQYTAQAMGAKIQGTVLIGAVVSVDGSVSVIAVLRSVDQQFGLDHEAVVAAKQWRFEPAKLHGQPVPTLITIEFQFKLRDP